MLQRVGHLHICQVSITLPHHYISISISIAYSQDGRNTVRAGAIEENVNVCTDVEEERAPKYDGVEAYCHHGRYSSVFWSVYVVQLFSPPHARNTHDHPLGIASTVKWSYAVTYAGKATHSQRQPAFPFPKSTKKLSSVQHALYGMQSGKFANIERIFDGP